MGSIEKGRISLEDDYKWDASMTGCRNQPILTQEVAVCLSYLLMIQVWKHHQYRDGSGYYAEEPMTLRIRIIYKWDEFTSTKSCILELTTRNFTIIFTIR